MTTTEEKRGRPKGSPNAPKSKPTVVINGQKVEDLRLARNWSQAELGRRCYITQARVSRIEGGEETPAVDTAWFLAQAFGVPLDDLIEVLEDGLGPTKVSPEDAAAMHDILTNMYPDQDYKKQIVEGEG